MKTRAAKPALLCWAVLSVACARNIPEKVTTDRLLALKKGMSYPEIEALIGPPLFVIDDEAPFQTHVVAARSTVQPELRNKPVTLSYAGSSTWDIVHSFRIYVNLAEGHLKGVYIKYDNYGVCCMDGLPTSPFYWIGSRDFLRKQIGR